MRRSSSSSGRGTHARIRAGANSTRGRVLTVLAVALAVAGITAFGVLSTGGDAPQSRAATGGPTYLPTPQGSHTAAAPTRGPVLDRSVPVELRIRTIHVRSHLLQLGLNPDGTVEVPPRAKAGAAGWYKYSPTPGERGPAILIGHADSNALGPGVFGRLGELHRGDRVAVVRADGTVAVFHVDRIGRYPKQRFPVAQVYGDIDYAGLRLITYGASPATGQGRSANVIVYASLVSSHSAG